MLNNEILIGLQHSTSQILIKVVRKLGGRQLKCFLRGLNIVDINVRSMGGPLRNVLQRVRSVETPVGPQRTL